MGKETPLSVFFQTTFLTDVDVESLVVSGRLNAVPETDKAPVVRRKAAARTSLASQNPSGFDDSPPREDSSKAKSGAFGRIDATAKRSNTKSHSRLHREPPHSSFPNTKNDNKGKMPTDKAPRTRKKIHRTLSDLKKFEN